MVVGKGKVGLSVRLVLRLISQAERDTAASFWTIVPRRIKAWAFGAAKSGEFVLDFFCIFSARQAVWLFCSTLIGFVHKPQPLRSVFGLLSLMLSYVDDAVGL